MILTRCLPFYTIFLVMLGSNVAGQNRKCSKQSDCVNRNAPRCAICADIGDGQNGTCVDVYKKDYLPSPTCARFDDSTCPLECGKGRCGTWRKISNMRSSAFCVCPVDSSFGERCQHDNPRGEPRFAFISVYFDGIMASTGVPFLMQINYHSEPSKLVEKSCVTLVKYKDHYERFPVYSAIELIDSYYITATLVRIQFPFKPYGDVYKLGDTLIGYKANVHLYIFIENKEVFAETYDVFVKYDNLRCYPIISTKHCADSKLDPKVLHRKDGLQLEFDVNYLYEGRIISGSIHQKCAEAETISWKIWKIPKDTARNVPTRENYIQSRTISLEPYELDIGEYELNITVTNVGLDIYHTNYVNCYFKISCVPLVAKVRGGSERIVPPSLSLVLKADESFDPNMPPNNQGHLNIEWSCVNILNPDKYESMCETKRTAVSEYYFAPAESLTRGAKYNFSIKVWTDKYDQIAECNKQISPQFAYLTIEVAHSNDSRFENVVVECITNCGVKVVPSNELVLKADQPLMMKVLSKDTYEWTFYENLTEIVYEDKILKGAHSYLLTIKRNSLNYGSSYRIMARARNSKWYATYAFDTFSITFNVNCSLTPTEGTKGLTQFEIICVILKNHSNDLLTFEFYDKYDEEEKDEFIFSGRMLGTSKEGSLKYVRLTRGNVLVYIITQHGTYMKNVFKVELKDWTIDNKILAELYHNVTNEMRFGNVQRVLGALSFIPDIVPVTMEKYKGHILTTLLDFATNVSLNDFGEMKISVSTLTNVLLKMNDPYQHHLKHRVVMLTFKSIQDQVEIFCSKILIGEVQYMGPQEVKQVAVSIINSIRAGLLSMDSQMVNIQEWSSDLSVFYDSQKVSLSVETSINLISKTLSYIQVPGHPPTRLSSNDGAIIAWVMESDDHSTFHELILAEDGIPVELSDKLYNYTVLCLSKDENIVLQVTSLKNNIYWWRSSDIYSNLVSVNINRKYNKTHILPIRLLDTPITILMELENNINSFPIKGTTFLPQSGSDTFDWDFNLQVHRFELEPRSVVTITFLFPETNATLRVLVKDQFRPDYTVMKNEGINITNTSSTYFVPYYNYINSFFIYMGVMPGAEVPANKFSVSYAFNIHVAVCQSWALGHWSSTGCVVKEVVKSKKVHCDCKHFSIFAVAIPMPPHSLDPFLDIKLFLSSSINPVVATFVIIVILVYLLLCVCLWLYDRLAVDKRSVIILEDNVSVDKNPYLVGVYTSPRFNAGTTAHVGIQLSGTKGRSRHHILSCKYRKVLQRNSDDWFLIYSPRRLGDVEGLRIWHDNVGSSPEWFCNKIIVYDLIKDRETRFIVEDWLALDEHEHPEAYILPAIIEEINSVKALFVYNLSLGIRENHGLLSAVSCHPRSRMPRLTRFTIFFSGLMFTMLCCIMSYLPEDEQMYYVDSYQYSIGTRQVIIGLQTTVISTLPTLILCILFKKSNTIVYTKPKNTLRVREDSLRYSKPEVQRNRRTVIYSYGTRPRVPAIGGSMYQTFVRMLSKVVKPSSMGPVQLPHSDPVVVVRWFWLILYWVVCFTIIGLSSYLVIVYGLKLGIVRSKEWLSSLCISMAVEMVLFAPLRIAIMSSLLAIAFLKMFDLDLYDIKEEDIRRARLPKSTQQILNAAKMRKLPSYKPITNEERDIILKRVNLKSKISTFKEFLVTILILYMFVMLMFKMSITYFQLNSKTVNMMTVTNKQIRESDDFYDMKSFSSFNKYMQHTFIKHLYNLRWYNDRPLNSDWNGETEEHWTSDFTHRPIGPPIIRQLRVVPQRCGNIVLKRGYCIPRWSNSTEENDDYSEMWKPASWLETPSENSPWRYTQVKGNWILNQYGFYSPSGVTYVPGGYLEVLGPTKGDTEFKLAKLVENAWLDGKTRVVFVEYFLYNVNRDVFVKVTLIVENLITGNILSIARAISFRARNNLNVCVCYVLIAPLVAYYLFRCVHILNRRGFMKFIHQFHNLSRLAIVLLGTASLMLFTIFYYVSSRYLELLRKRAQDKSYFDFDTLLFYTLLYHVQATTVCVVYLHAISLVKSKIFKIGPGSVNFIKMDNFTFITTLNWIFWLTVNVVILSISLKLISSLFDDHGFYNVKNIMIIKRSLRNFQPEEYQYLHTKMFAFSRIAIITTCLWSFVITFMAKVHKNK